MMVRRSTSLMLLAMALSLMVSPVHADRGDRGYGGSYHGARPGMGTRSSPSFPPPDYGYSHVHGGGRHFWGPFGLVVGSALLYSALQPRTTYTYESRTIYAPPPVTVYYAPLPAPVVQYQEMPAAPMTTVTVVPVPVSGYSPQVVVDANTQSGPGASGAVWWYMCRNPAGYYPHVTECPTGWEKVIPAPPPAP